MTEPRRTPRGDVSRGSHLLAWSVVVLFALGIVGYALIRPGANTDLIFYAATVHHWDGLDTEAIHEASLADAREHLAPDVYARMIDENEYMRIVTADPEALVQQIQFYSVKVLFPSLMIALRGLGIPLGFSQLLISLVSYFALCLLVFAWLRRHIALWPAVLVAVLISVSPPWWALARIQSPDALGALLGVGALYLLLELRRTSLAFVLLMAAVLVRPNAAVMLVAVAVCLALLVQSHTLHLAWRRAVLWSVAGVALAAGLTLVTGNYGLGTLFYHAVVEYLPYPAAGSPQLDLNEIVRIYAFKLATIGSTFIPLFVLLGVLAIWIRVTPRALPTDAPCMVIVAMFATIAIGYATYPNEPERILATPFLACTMILAVSSLPFRHGRAAGAPIAAGGDP